MVRPLLLPRLKQAYVFARNRVRSIHTITLESVAHAACKPKVLLLVRPAACDWGKVVKFERRKDMSLRTLAVSAPIIGLSANTSS